MNKGIISLNVVLLVAVVVLYFFHFSNEKPEAGGKEEPAQLPAVAESSSGTIAFVNSDILLEKYALVGKLSKQLEKESRKKDADLANRQKELEGEAAYFQESIQNNSLSEKNAQNIYDQLMQKQQEIYQLGEQFAAELAQEEFRMNVILLDSVRNYLGRMNADNKYDYILNYNASGSIFIAKDTFDITNVVLDGLNREYDAKYTPENK